MTSNDGQNNTLQKLRQLAALIFNLKLPPPFATVTISSIMLSIGHRATIITESDDGRAKQTMPPGTYLILKLEDHALNEADLQGITLIVIPQSAPQTQGN